MQPKRTWILLADGGRARVLVDLRKVITSEMREVVLTEKPRSRTTRAPVPGRRDALLIPYLLERRCQL